MPLLLVFFKGRAMTQATDNDDLIRSPIPTRLENGPYHGYCWGEDLCDFLLGNRHDDV